MAPASKEQFPKGKHKHPSKKSFGKDVLDAVCNGLQTRSKLTFTRHAIMKRCI